MNPHQVVDFNRLAGEPDGRQEHIIITNNFLHLVEEVGEMGSNLRKALGNRHDREAFEATVDGAIDTIYMAVQVMLKMGLSPAQIELAWNEVCERNMEKGEPCDECNGTGEIRMQGDYDVCADCSGNGLILKRDHGGKIIKPKDWMPPSYEWLSVVGWTDSPHKG